MAPVRRSFTRAGAPAVTAEERLSSARLERDRHLRSIFIGVLAVSLYLCGRLVYIQVIRHSFYLELAAKYQPADHPRAGQPGAITDRDGRVLADSVTTASIKINPHIAQRHEDINRMASFIAGKLGLDPGEVLSILKRDSEFAYIARRVDLTKANVIMAANFAGVGMDLEYSRSYPNGRMACHVIGVRSSDHRPLEGLELRYRFLLDGAAGTPITNVDAFGRTIVGQEGEPALSPVAGMNLVTTLDLNIQRTVESELDRCMQERRAQAATCVVMDPRTGEILAMASRPNYDPSVVSGAGSRVAHAALSRNTMQNRCVTRQYEPGSTFKPLVVAAALDAGAITVSDTFDCPGTVMLGGKPLHCAGQWASRGHGVQTAEQVLINSCNIGAAKIAVRLGAPRLVDFLHNAGIAQLPRCGLAGEAAGQLQDSNKMRVRDLANVGFGQNVAITDIQLISAISAVLNSGIYARPHILKAVNNKDGALFREVNPQLGPRVCSAQTSALLRKFLVSVVENAHGTGKKGRIPGVCVGGKTGTAQMWNPQARRFEGHIVSFVMFAPMDTLPQFAILVTVQEPKVGASGGEVAAPVAREIMRSILQRRGLIKPVSSNT